jgi:hypothetical protein
LIASDLKIATQQEPSHMTTHSPQFFNTVGKRLFTIALIVIFTCVMITLVLQPTGTSAQEPEEPPLATATPLAGNDLAVGKEISPTATSIPVDTTPTPSADKAPQPTPTPQGAQRSAMESAVNGSDGPDDGTPITSTRGYSNLMVSIYNASDLSGVPVYTDDWRKQIDYELWCSGEESTGFPSCKLVNEIAWGGSYSARWQGYLVVPVDGDYTFWFGKVDDGARFYLDNNLLINFWTQSAPPAVVTLEAGLHTLKVEYQQRIPNAVALQVK